MDENYEVHCNDCNWDGDENELEINIIDGDTYCPVCFSFAISDIT